MKVIDWNIGNKCNLNCTYCYLGPDKHLLSNNLDISTHLPQLIELNKQEELHIHFIGGEPFLVNDFIKQIEQLLFNNIHVTIITNLITGDYNKLVTLPNLKLLTIIGSLHYFENERLNLHNKWLQNYYILRTNNITLDIQLVGHPTILEKIEHLNSIYNIKYNFIEFRGKYNSKIYPDSYSKTELDKFKFTSAISSNRFNTLCSAGKNIISIEEHGYYAPCVFILHDHLYSDKKYIKSISDGIVFNTNDITCPYDNICSCPPSLFFGE